MSNNLYYNRVSSNPNTSTTKEPRCQDNYPTI